MVQYKSVPGKFKLYFDFRNSQANHICWTSGCKITGMAISSLKVSIKKRPKRVQFTKNLIKFEFGDLCTVRRKITHFSILIKVYLIQNPKAKGRTESSLVTKTQKNINQNKRNEQELLS